MKKSPLLTPGEVYKSRAYGRGGLAKARAVAFKYFTEHYFNTTEDLKTFIPGGIYTFSYIPLTKSTLDFYDKRPIILCLKRTYNKNTKNWIEQGINLNFLPHSVKVKLLDAIYHFYTNSIEKSLIKDNGKPAKLFHDEKKYLEILDAFATSIMKSDYRFAIRNYINTRITSPSTIQYEDWGLVPLIESTQLVGATLNDIFKSYKNHMKIQKKKNK